MSDKFCVDCKHYLGPSAISKHTCRRRLGYTTDVVTGKEVECGYLESCHMERVGSTRNGACGPFAEYFEPK